ncbi:5-methylthioadenosine/S-adenosylhomocysteine deaminase [uncultured delta proteobacterium]|uniref:5-methylthioadenosine/S-adenosylhomocysteine deaminase n=1 Tax=uncultured delta proteobacterium TaxID=34034 RepID=A0A212ITJ1_9DELT|nr:5-methylthioadenosine/S-adenosylhomocysteine deaminase [uncultured delta proteobacterium]
MSTEKLPCSIVVTARYLLQNAREPIVRDAAAAIKDTRILALGKASDILREYAPETRLDMGESLLMPGLINGHTHASMSLLRGVADDLPLLIWLTEHIFPREKKLDPESIGLGAALACAEMTRFGVTAFADMYLAENAVFDAAASSGLRMLGGEGIFAFPSPGYNTEDEAFTLLREQVDRWKDHPRIRVAVMPHAVYTTTPDLLARCRDTADALGLSLHIHLAETRHETDECRKNHCKTPLRYCADLGLVTSRTTIAHGVVFDDEELDLLAASGACVVHCPRSNMKLASGVARVPAMLAKGIPVGLGTDGAASSNNLNMFQEMAAAALLHKVHNEDPTVVAARDAIAMATIHGARALHWPGLGELRRGGPADVIAVDMTPPNMRPVHSPTSNIVYAATGAEVRLTMVDGEILYKDGEYTRMDIEALYAKAQQAADRLR